MKLADIGRFLADRVAVFCVLSEAFGKMLKKIQKTTAYAFVTKMALSRMKIRNAIFVTFSYGAEMTHNRILYHLTAYVFVTQMAHRRMADFEEKYISKKAHMRIFILSIRICCKKCNVLRAR